jgi:hypothetical protein
MAVAAATPICPVRGQRATMEKVMGVLSGLVAR